MPPVALDAFLTWGLEEQTPEQGSELPTTIKSAEELAKFTVDENLSDTERTVLFLNGGQIIQQRHAIANLPSVIRARGRQGWESVAGPLKTALNRLDMDCQIEAAEVFAYIAKERLMPPADLQACLLSTVVRNINREKSEEETEAWMRALFELMPMLDKEALRTEVLSMALSKGDMEDNVASRVICSRILGAIALHLTKEEVERSFFKRALKMCQDVDHQVRRSAAQQLVVIGRTAGKEAVQHTVLDELVELLKDEDVQVRAAAFTSLVQLLDLLTLEQRKQRVMPILRDHVIPFDMDTVMQGCVAKSFGHILKVIKGELEQDDAQMIYGCYKHFSSKTDVELRRTCAQQLGQVVRAASSTQPNAYQQHFSEVMQTFATDFDEEVRVAVAAQLHELAWCSGKDQCCQLITRPLVQLLRDESRRVQAAVLPNLTATLQQFAQDRSAQRASALDEIVRALMDLEANSTCNWRLQVRLASAFPAMHLVFASDQIYEHFLPMAFRFLSHSAAAARPAAAEGVACVLRYTKKDKQRAELFLQLIRDFARGKCYQQRLAFAEVCSHLIKRFSSKFIKEWVFDLCLELLYDPVPNVRLQVTHLLPSLKQTVRLPEDVDLLERLNNAISNSMTDNDRDVSQTARLINDTYKRMPVRLGGGSSTFINSTGGAMAAYEAEDKKKEAEEVECTFSTEDIKEIKAEIVQMNYKKKPGGPEPPVAGKSAINRRPDVGTKPGVATGAAAAKAAASVVLAGRSASSSMAAAASGGLAGRTAAASGAGSASRPSGSGALAPSLGGSATRTLGMLAPVASKAVTGPPSGGVAAGRPSPSSAAAISLSKAPLSGAGPAAKPTAAASAKVISTMVGGGAKRK